MECQKVESTSVEMKSAGRSKVLQLPYSVAGDYTRDEMDYLRETARTESVYGISRVERILLRVNQALRKQNFDLTRFTDGATPLGLIQPPPALPGRLTSWRRSSAPSTDCWQATTPGACG